MLESDRHDRGYYRARAPLAPYAATLEGEPPPPSIQALANLTRVELGAEPTRVEVGPDVVLVEGAGGILTPIDRTTSIADLASALSFPTLLVARDELGVLSQVLCAAESAWAHRLHLAGVVLVRTRAALDRSASTNARILSERLDAPVRIFPCTDDDDDALAEAAEDSGIVSDIVLRALARRTG